MKAFMTLKQKLILFNLHNKKSVQKPPRGFYTKDSFSFFYISEPNAEYESH